MAKSTKSSAPAGQNRLYLILGAVVLVVVAALAYFSIGGGQAATEPVAIEIDPAELQRAQGVAMGSEEAPVLLYEFADFQCPACAQFSTFAHPLIKERLVDQGIVRLVRYDFPLVLAHPQAFLASRAARCAGDQGRYWEFHDVLYGRQPNWSGQRNVAGEFEEYAELVGIDRGQFASCLNSDQHAEEVTRNLRLGESLGVSGTPTLLLNGERVQVSDYNDLEARVFEAGRAPCGGTDDDRLIGAPMNSPSTTRIQLVFADEGTFHSVVVTLPTDRLDEYDRLVDLLREEPSITRQLYVDMRRLVSASVVESA